MPVDVLLVFSDRDKEGAAELERHLTPLTRSSKIRLWHRGKILVGEDAGKKWREQVQRAQIILLLVSSDLEIDCDSDIADALEQRKGREARVIPVVWRAVSVSDLRYREMRMIPDGGPVSARRDRDQAWVEVVQGISRVVEVMGTAAVPSPAEPRPDVTAVAGAAADARSHWAPAQTGLGAPQASSGSSPPHKESDRIKILFIGANPANTSRLKLAEEIHEIDRRILAGSHRDRFELRDAWAVTPAELSQILLRHCPTVLHFSGHGGKKGEIVLNDENGQGRAVAAPALSRLFKMFVAKGLRCVVLNACYSEEQAKALAQHVDCIVGITGEIADSAAFAFAAGFYTGVAQGETVQFSFELGCTQVALAGGADPDQAKLMGRPGVDLGTMRLA